MRFKYKWHHKRIPYHKIHRKKGDEVVVCTNKIAAFMGWGSFMILPNDFLSLASVQMLQRP